MTDTWSHKSVVLKLCSVARWNPLYHIITFFPCPPPILTWRQLRCISYFSNNTLPDSQLLYLLYFPTLGWTEMAYVLAMGRNWRIGTHFIKKRCFEEVCKPYNLGHCPCSNHRSRTSVFAFRLFDCHKNCSSWLCWMLPAQAHVSFCVSCCHHLGRTIVLELGKDTISLSFWMGAVLCSANHFWLAEHKR